jgi:glycosyltransferase involved in cell wall biosynthesis
MDTGGAQKVVLDIVTNLDRSRFSPHVCTLRGGGAFIAKLDEERIPHHMSFFSSRFSLLGLWRLRKLLKELEIDVVHTHLRRSNISAQLAARWAGVPVIIGHCHDTLKYKKGIHSAVIKKLVKKADRFLAVSDAVAESKAKSLGLDEDLFTTFYNFINPEEYRLDFSAHLAKADIGVPVENPCIGIVGRLHPLKGHDLFLDAAFILNQKRPDVHFAVIGDGQMKTELIERVRQQGMMHKVSFVGFSHEIARVYKALDCLALCSSSEGLGMVLLEAQSAGVPVVAKAVGGVKEVLAGGGGILIDEEKANPDTMAAAFEEALKPGVTRMLRSQMPANLNRFNAVRQITNLEDMYEEMCEKKKVKF